MKIKINLFFSGQGSNPGSHFPCDIISPNWSSSPVFVFHDTNIFIKSPAQKL